MRKLHILLPMAVLLGLAACNVLDQDPHSAIPRNKVTAEHIPLLYTGLYNYVQYKPTDNGYLQGDFCGGDFSSNSATVYASPALWIRSLVLPTSGFISGPWSGYYSCLYQVNQFIELVSQQAPSQEFDRMLGTARFFRALIYYNLVTRWGGVPILRQCTNDPVPNGTLAECWAFIGEDLAAAIEKCPDFTAKWYVSKSAAQALMARSLLAQGKKAEAAAYSEQVIGSGLFALDDFSNIFRGLDNKEEIFSLRNKNDENGISFSGTFYVASGGYVPRDEVVNLFSSADKRLTTTICNYEGTTVLGKYINRGDEYHQLYIIRLAEMYLISAEGLGYDQGGADRLNQLRAARGLGAVSVTSEAQMLEAVLAERRLELLGEGFRWFDLVRTGKYPATLGLEEKYTVLPVPTRELDLNPLLKQNELWK